MKVSGIAAGPVAGGNTGHLRPITETSTMTTQQTPNRPHLEITVTDFHTLHTAMDLSLANTWDAVGEMAESGNVEGARAASAAFAQTKALHDRLFIAAHDAVGNEKPFGELPGSNQDLTLMVSMLVSLKGNANASLADTEHMATHTAEEVEHVRELATNADNLAKRLAAFIRENDPQYAAAFARSHATTDKTMLPGWSTSNELSRATFEEFAQLIGGNEFTTHSARLQ